MKFINKIELFLADNCLGYTLEEILDELNMRQYEEWALHKALSELVDGGTILRARGPEEFYYMHIGFHKRYCIPIHRR